MTTMTISTNAFSKAPAVTPAAKPGFFHRLVTAIAKSRQRQADIEIRRVRTMIGAENSKIDYAMLPFSGE